MRREIEIKREMEKNVKGKDPICDFIGICILTIHNFYTYLYMYFDF
jgi:hypothetical protein